MAQSKKNIDLEYKHIRAVVAIQGLYRERKQMVTNLNKRLTLVYGFLISIMNRINSNYHDKIIDKEQYVDQMAFLDKCLKLFQDLPNPVSLSMFREHHFGRLHWSLRYLEHEIFVLCKGCGASSLFDVMKIIIGENWNISLRYQFQQFMKFYNNVFSPVSVKILGQIEHLNQPKVMRLSLLTRSPIMKIHGAEIYVPIMGKIIVIRGYFADDPLNIAKIGLVKDKYRRLIIESESVVPSDVFRMSYIEQLNLRDFLLLNVDELTKHIRDAWGELNLIKTNPPSQLYKEFSRDNLDKKSRLLTLLLLDPESQKLAKSLTSLILSSEQSLVLDDIYRLIHWSVQRRFDEISRTLPINEILVENSDIPYETRIFNMKCSEPIRRRAFDKLREIHNSKEGNEKATKYLDNLLRIPFGTYRKEKILSFLSDFRIQIAQVKESVNELDAYKKRLDKQNLDQNVDENDNVDENMLSLINQIERLFEGEVHTANDIELLIRRINESADILIQCVNEFEPEHLLRVASSKLLELSNGWAGYKQKRREFMDNANQKLDCIYGQKDAKQTVQRIIGQWLNGEMEGAVFGFQGPPGTGKTSLAKEGLSQCLADTDGQCRPFAFISLGGSTNGSMLEGHGYTYVGSKWGRIVDTLMDVKCLNPIIYFDELDKVSNTPHGNEIIGILTHLTDPVQNEEFMDRYFDGIKIDLSKALIIFSYNDPDKIDSILKERITEIRFKHLDKREKIHVGKHYLLPKILKDVGYKTDELRFTDDSIEHIVESYVYEAGVRNLKQKLFEIAREINVRCINDEVGWKVPLTVDRKLVDDILENKNKITFTKIPSKPQIGWVNGLYASSIGTGGLTVIQVFDTPSDVKMSLELTGNLGDVMQESMRCARTVTWQQLSGEIKEQLNTQWRESGPFGLHIHVPSAGTPKDGPSAGAAITTAIISFLTKRPVRNYIAMTGEIELYGNVHAIGGLQAKIEGAIRAGVKIVLIPKENHSDWEEISHQYEKAIHVVEVEHIGQVLEICLIDSARQYSEIPEELRERLRGLDNN